MDLKKILEKTKAKTENIIVNRKPPSIAVDDRPYSSQEINEIYSPKNILEAKNKPETNERQSKDKLETNWRQTEDKPEANFKENSSNKRQTKDETRDKYKDKLETNWRQTEDIVLTNNLLFTFSNLVGLQRKIAILFFKNCKLNRSKITQQLTIEYITHHCQSTVASVKKTLQRLEAKKIIRRVAFKNGRSGWTQYELSQNIYQEMLHHETELIVETKWGQTRDKVESQPETEPETTSSSSSSILYNINTTTLPESWSEIDIKPLCHTGFSHAHLLQLYKLGLYTDEVIQNSIYHFAFDLKHHGKAKEIKTSPLSYFMGILRKSGPYIAPPDYESPQDRTQRLYVENLRRIQQKREETKKEAFNMAFKNWYDNLSDDEIKEILIQQNKDPLYFKDKQLDDGKVLKKRDSMIIITDMKQYFEEEIWPKESFHSNNES